MANIRPLCSELAVKARDELHEVGSRIPEDIIALRTWIKKQPHLKARTDDQFLVTFLRGSKYSIEKAKQKIDYYYAIKSLSPDLFLHKRHDDKTIKLTKIGFFLPLPKPLKPDGPRLHITRYGPLDPKEFQLVDMLKHQLRVLEIQLHEDDNCIVSGFINIMDLSSVSLGFVLQFDPSLIRKISVFSDKAVPFRIKGMHMVNAPKEAAVAINIARNLMPTKLRERLHVHTNFESLYEHVPKEYLPEEYGGTNGCIQDTVDVWVKRMEGYNQFFEENLAYGADEKLRVGTKFSSESLFGLDGSFRKLEVD